MKNFWLISDVAAIVKLGCRAGKDIRPNSNFKHQQEGIRVMLSLYFVAF